MVSTDNSKYQAWQRMNELRNIVMLMEEDRAKEAIAKKDACCYPLIDLLNQRIEDNQQSA